jgi:ribosome-associated toxin RatA of RatAB toxin-antitoxin module
MNTRIEVARLPIAPEAVERASGPLLEMTLGPKGLPIAACAAAVVDAAPDHVFEVLTDIERYAGRIPLMHKARVHGDWAEFSLRLKLAFFGVGFSFASNIAAEPGRSLALRYRSGEPKDIAIHYDIAPVSSGDPDRCLIYVHIGFDIESLGWLVKLFLKHHPEIQFGVFSGCALALLESMRTAACEV